MGWRWTALLLWAAAAVVQSQPTRALDEWLAVCAACHGPRGQSAIAGMPSLAAQPRLFIENQLVIIREGLRDVPAMTAVMNGMADEEIRQLAAYYAAQPAKPAPAAPQVARVRAATELSRRLLCGTCHLPSYAGQQQVPRLAGQDEAYLLLSMKQLRENPGPGRDTIMAATLRGLSDDDLASLAHYLAHFAP